MLTQSESRIDLRQMMDEGKIFLASLSSLGTELRDTLGCFLLTLIHMTALGRESVPAQERRVCHVYCDEAHRFVTSAVEDLIAETRKYNVSLMFAYQYRSQFPRERSDALAAVGTTVAFNVNQTDAQYLSREFRGLAKPEDFVELEVGHAIARIGTEVVRIHTPGPRTEKDPRRAAAIIAASHRKYYARTEDVRRAIARRDDRWNTSFADLSEGQMVSDAPEDLHYDEFA